MNQLLDTFSVSKINFGDIDGREEAKLDNFEALFYEKDNYYLDLMNSSKFLILGRKGTGKTILVNYLKKKNIPNPDVFINLLDISDVTSKKLQIFHNEDIQKDEMDSFWEYVFLLEFSEQIISESSFFQKLFPWSNVKKLRKEIEESRFYLSGFNETNKIEGSLGMSESAKFTSKVKAGSEVTKTYTKAKYYNLVKSLSPLIKNRIKIENKKRFIIYDDVDELYDQSKDRDFFLTMMNAMIRSAKRFNDNYFNSSGLKVILVFRKDILKELQSRASNLNKIVGSSSININWIDYQKDINNPLIKLVIHKIRYSTDLYSESNETIFDAVLRQESSGDTLVGLLLDRTFGRPRDVINFLKIYQEDYPLDKRFLIKNLKKCYKKYSEWFYNEIANEIHILENKKEIEETIRAIQEMKKKRFSIDELKMFIHDSESFPSYEIKNLRENINKLYELSIIGNISNKGNTVEFFYRTNHSSNANFDMNFIVHFGIQPYLSL